MELAKQRETDHPADALAIYRAQIDPIVSQTNNGAYHEAIKLLYHIKAMMGRLHQQEQFAVYLADLRKTYKPKRNFVAMLAQLD